MKQPYPIIAAVLLCTMCGPAAAAVTAALDRDQIAEGETVQLSLQRDGQGGGEPDLGPLKKDFDVLGSSSSSNIQLVNGHLSSQRQLQLTLAPRHTGTLQIPALSWDGEQTQPLGLTVAASSAAASGSGQAAGNSQAPVFLTSTLSQQRPYVQGSVLLTVQIHAAQPLYQASLDFGGNSDVSVLQIGKDRQFSESRDGRRYDVIERRYLLQPQRSGSISLDGPTLDAQVTVAGRGIPDPFGPGSPFSRAFGGTPFSGMFGTTKPVRLHGDAIGLEVRPRPAAATARDWLPATQLSVEESWTPDGAEVHAGDPLTLHLRLRATGLSGAQLPDLGAELSLPEGLKAYPDQAKLGTELQGSDIVGTRSQDIALIADRAGRYQVPALRVQWWDTAKDMQREVLLPQRTLEVAASAGGSTAPAEPRPAPPAPQGGGADKDAKQPPASAPLAPTTSAWPWISLTLLVLWLATLAAWWRKRKSARSPGIPPEPAAVPAPAPVVEAGVARRAFQQACRDKDPHAARQNLLRWARAVYPTQAPAGLEALSRRLDPAAAPLLQQLDRACYAGGTWDGDQLLQALHSLEPKQAMSQPKTALPDLYS